MFLFLLLMVLLTPAIMLIFGALWQTKPPKEVNGIYGYRTTRSMKSKEAWDYAHKYFGKLWIKSGVITMILSIIAMIIFHRNFENASIIIILFQTIIICLAIIPTESSLKKHFDNNGRPLN